MVGRPPSPRINQLVLIITIEYFSQMEEKSVNELALTTSGWKLKQEGLKNQRNHRQLENRLIILELERQGKVKSIEQKLEGHRRLMEIRMDRFKLKQLIENNDKSIEDEAGTNSRIFREVRMNRATNIRSRSNQCKSSNQLMFREIKKQRANNERLIRQESERELQLKTQKRNKVRMIEIECKENVDKFWRGKLQDFKETREQEISRNMGQEENKLQSLLHLERSEGELLSEIRKADEMESQLLAMMAEEQSMVTQAIGHRL